ncbi:MAG: cytochrome c3 family protein [Nitrospirota bacterium]|nr:MAG: cytochrome c3 family protein [Nitrospirota bacterium]
MERKYILTACLLIALITCLILAGCGQTGDVTVSPASIPVEDETIIFPVSNGPQSDVVFSHKTHSEQYLSDVCMTCHKQDSVREDTIWNCNECHSADDSENYCADDPDGHSCWMVQCDDCHKSLSVPDPTPLCIDCHTQGNVGIFADVEGLFYSTATKKGITNASGTFSYQSGETSITFSVGEILVGSGAISTVMTPVDLVTPPPTPPEENDQTVINISRFLQTLDADCNYGNGISIPSAVMNYTQGRIIDFTAPDDTTFESDADLVAFLADMDSAGLIPCAGSPLSLIATATAQINLRATFDKYSGGGCYVSAIQSSPLAVTVAYNPDIGQSFSYQWYRADDIAGTNEAAIVGANSATYFTSGTDNNKFITVGITSNGTTSMCKPVVPDNISNSITVYGDISSEDEIDVISLQLTSPAGMIADLVSYEPGSPWKSHQGSPCAFCHGSNYYGPQELLFRDYGSGSSNGPGNDKLISNIILLDSSNNLVDIRDGIGSCAVFDPNDNGAEYALGGNPGCVAPRTFGTPGAKTDYGIFRSAYNPYMDLSGSCSDPLFESELTCTAPYCDD